jgi:hypothetical protein
VLARGVLLLYPRFVYVCVMGCCMSRVGAKRVQVRLSDELGSQVEALARRLGVPESAVGSMLIAAGLARYAEVMNDPTLLGTVTEAAMVGVREVEELPARRSPAPVSEPVDRVGFRPGPGPRSELIEVPVKESMGVFDEYFGGGRSW